MDLFQEPVIDLRKTDLSRPVTEQDALTRFALRFFLRTFTKVLPHATFVRVCFSCNLQPPYAKLSLCYFLSQAHESLVEKNEKSKLTLWWGKVLRRLLTNNVPSSAWLLHLFAKVWHLFDHK